MLGRPWHGEHNDVPERDVSAGYFTTLGARLLRGRYFNDERQRVEAAAWQLSIAHLKNATFPAEDAIGKQIVEHGTPPTNIQIVGIVDDIREGPLDAAIPPVLYSPFNQSPDNYFSLVVRTSQDERPLLPLLAAAIRQIDPAIVPMKA